MRLIFDRASFRNPTQCAKARRNYVFGGNALKEEKKNITKPVQKRISVAGKQLINYPQCGTKSKD